MSELFEDLIVSYPKTVTACHREIERLERMVAEADKALIAKDAELDEKSQRIDDLEAEVSDLEDEARERQNELDATSDSAINSFLDECERTGPLRFDVPQTDRVNRAIIALHDAVGRQP